MNHRKRSIAATLAAALLLLFVWRLSTGDEKSGCVAQADVPAAETNSGTRALESSSPDAQNGEIGAREPMRAAENGTASTGAANATLELRGRVIDANDQPVIGADVVVILAPARTFDSLPDFEYMREEQQLAAARTDSAGEFSFTLRSSGPFDLHVRAESCAEAVAANVFTGQFVLVHVSRGATLRGQVRRAVDRVPVAGAHVIVRNDVAEKPVFEGRTDAAGNYRVEGLAAGLLTLQVIPELELHRNIDLELEPGEQRLQDVDVELGPRVTGEVRDKATGRPIAGAEVSSWSFMAKTVRTDAHGRYALSGVKTWRALQVSARASGYGELDVFVDTESNQESSVDFALSPGRNIIGRIVSTRGEPIAVAYVAAVGMAPGVNRQADLIATRSAADGRFVLKDVRTDLDHVLFARKEQFASVTLRIPNGSPNGGPLTVGDVVLPDAASVSGFVTDEEGSAIPDVGIGLQTDSDDPLISLSTTIQRSAASDDRGRFHVGDLAPGKYRMRFYRDGLRALDDVRVELAEGEARRDFHVTLESQLSIEGRVLDPFGSGFENALVSVSFGKPKDSVRSASAKDGSFKISSLPRGRFTLHVDPRDLLELNGEEIELARTNVADVEAGTKNVQIQLSRAAMIEGTVQRSDGSIAAHAGIVAHVAQGLEIHTVFSDESGRFRLKVAAGSVVDLFAYPTRADAQSVSGYALIENGESSTSARGVLAGSSSIVLRFPN